MDDLRTVLAGSWGSSCWCMFPRLRDPDLKALPGEGSSAERKRAAMTGLARKRRAPGLLAYREGEPVGWVALAPRPELRRVDASRATPRVDEVDVWIIPCVTIRPDARGQGIATELIRAATRYAFDHGAPAVEAYPRAGAARTRDDNAYFGTEPLFRRAGFRQVRGELDRLPRNWTPRVTMRFDRVG